jgi:DNA-binding ferritin-like protein
MNLEERVHKIKSQIAELYTRLGYNPDGSKKGFKTDHRPASNAGKKYSLQEKLASISKKR